MWPNSVRTERTAFSADDGSATSQWERPRVLPQISRVSTGGVDVAIHELQLGLYPLQHLVRRAARIGRPAVQLEVGDEPAEPEHRRGGAGLRIGGREQLPGQQNFQDGITFVIDEPGTGACG